MTNEEIDAGCQNAMNAGAPFCPWIGTDFYAEHWARKQAAIFRRMREVAQETLQVLEKMRDE